MEGWSLVQKGLEGLEMLRVEGLVGGIDLKFFE